MAYEKTEWKDRQVQNPRTYSVRDNEDGTITLLDAPGEITEAGTPVNAKNLNNIEQGIFDIHNYFILKNISETSGTIALENNKIHVMSINDATTFTLPDPEDKGSFNQIKVMAKITGTPTITWGTDQFFNKSIPEIEEGNFDFYFDYDNNLSKWVCGAIIKGVAS